MAKNSLGGEGEAFSGASPTKMQLAGICVEAARKSLVILQHLRKREILGQYRIQIHDTSFRL